MKESLMTFFIGSFIIWNLVVRYRTINSQAFIKNAQVSVFIFTSFAVGLSMISPEKTLKITRLLLENDTARLYLYASPALMPMIFKVLHGNTFSSSLALNMDVVATPIVLFYALNYFVLPENKTLFLIAYFIVFAGTLGFIHSLLGSILASFNIALVVASYFNKNLINISLNNIFDFLDYLGIVSPAAKWFMLVISTAVAIHSSINPQWLREMLNHGFFTQQSS